MKIRRQFDLHGEAEQEALGAALARICRAPALIYLDGDLGAGKTTLVRGWLRSLGHGGAVKSPTYTLIEPYEIDGAAVYHLDLYRVGDPGELEYLGLREMLAEDAVLLDRMARARARAGCRRPIADPIAHWRAGTAVDPGGQYPGRQELVPG